MAALSLLLLLITVSLTRSENNVTYVFGLPLSFQERYSSSKLSITTTSKENITYTITIGNILVSTGFVNVKQSREVALSKEYITVDSSSINRHKGIIVEASGSVSVTAYTWLIQYGGSAGALRVLPYKTFHTLSKYRYYGISTRNQHNSLMLLVGYENGTKVQIRPSVNVSIPRDIHQDSDLVTIPAGTTHNVVLHRGQTLLLKVREEDLSGTEVIANRPLSVISGHECANVPVNVGGCDHILTQIPPTVMWGKNFILMPFSGRTGGQVFKVVSADNNTTLYHDCTNNSTVNTVRLSSGTMLEFNTSSYKACHVKSDKPIIVAQFSVGKDIDGLGDPTLMIVPPLEQYVKRATFQIFLPQKEFPMQYMNVIVPSESFKHTSVRLDGKQIQSDWSVVYAVNSTDVLGYMCAVPVGDSDTHTVTNLESNGRLAVMMYGFNPELRQGYAYNTRMAMLPLNAVIKVKFSSSNYQVKESEGFVTVEVWRTDNVATQTQVAIKVESGTAILGQDFEHFQEMITFDIGETQKTIRVPIINDQWVEEMEYFKVKVQPAAQLSTSKEARIEILDDDDINIGFSMFPDAAGNMRLQVDTFSGKLQPAVPQARVHLRVEFITSDMASYSERVNISHNQTKIMVSCLRCENTTAVVGLLELVDSERINRSRIKLYPSVTLLHAASTVSYHSLTQTSISSPLPVIMSRLTHSGPLSLNVAIIVGFASSFCTILVAIIIGLIGCYMSYKYGKNNGYRFQHFNTKRDHDSLNVVAMDKYFVQSVSN